MIYLACYLLVGLVLVIAESPIRAMVDKEIRHIEFSCLAGEQEVPGIKLLLFRIILSAILILIYPIMLFADLKAKWRRRKDSKQSSRPKPISHASWLGDKISVQEAEAKYMADVDGQDIPFGYAHNQWKKLLQQRRWRDELYEFRSQDESWESLSGVAGIALTRKGEIIADIVTRMS